MPIPIIIGIAAGIAALTGTKKSIEGVKDNNEAKEVREKAEDIVDNARNRIKKSKREISYCIENLGKEKLEISANELNDFIRIFSKIKNIDSSEIDILDELKNINLFKEEIKEIEEITLKATDVLGQGIAGVGAGALLGWGTYGGVMALGTASTGTAIGGLSGVAATNATLAWLGGGSLAAGGGGMALGSMVLGGVIAGPALLLSGSLLSSKAKKNLNNAYSNFSEARTFESNIEKGIIELEYIKDTANQIAGILRNIKYELKTFNYKMDFIINFEKQWSKFSIEEKQIIAAEVKMAQLAKLIISTPLLNENGMLTVESKKILNDK
jgi:hypothetical protein